MVLKLEANYKKNLLNVFLVQCDTPSFSKQRNQARLIKPRRTAHVDIFHDSMLNGESEFSRIENSNILSNLDFLSLIFSNCLLAAEMWNNQLAKCLSKLTWKKGKSCYPQFNSLSFLRFRRIPRSKKKYKNFWGAG